MSGAQITAIFMLCLIGVAVVFIAGFYAGQWWESQAKPASKDLLDEFDR